MSQHSRVRVESKTTVTNSQSMNATPAHLRALILDYLCHNCYSSTARAFAHDSAVRHLDADGDEIMKPRRSLDSSDSELPEEVLRLVQHREQVRTHILSGRVDDATDLLNKYFPSVLSSNESAESRSHHIKESKPTSAQNGYIPSTSVDPAHLSLNLRILAFIEASRTIPLEYDPPNSHVSNLEPPESRIPLEDCSHKVDSNLDREGVQSELLLKAQKLYMTASMLPDPKDRATYIDELALVGGLILAPVPEESVMSRYLSQERREAVADQINSAILYRTGLPAVSFLELCTRHTSTVWSFMHDLRIKPPPVDRRPPGVQLPPSASSTLHSASKGNDKETDESVPMFDLRQFLDSKT